MLSKAGREFCYQLSDNIMPNSMRQKIRGAETDNDVLYLIRHVCHTDIFFLHFRSIVINNYACSGLQSYKLLLIHLVIYAMFCIKMFLDI